ncbi:MAG: hypothetical protein JWP44_2467 [Mucilaginibacter sp.]|nr:hypothetical protein [Mucilaginibacter sp.]
MATIIDLNQAKSLIQEYRQQNATSGGPALVTPDKKFHHGFFINRKIIEDMLSNPNVLGISIDLAKHPDFTGSSENVFTLILSGAEPATAASTPYVNTGNIYCAPPPCPPFCVDLG